MAGGELKAWEVLGAHLETMDGVDGLFFSVWAPNAAAVSVVCDLNDWQPGAWPLSRRGPIWAGFYEALPSGARYMYAVTDRAGKVTLKADPFAVYAEDPGGTASRFWDMSGHVWHDQQYFQYVRSHDPYRSPMNIYEMHIGSWKRHPDSSYYSYTELADELIPYLLEGGYTHVEFLPLTGYPYDPSWGYQVTCYYAATARFGTPQQLMELVDRLHMAGIGVLLDWVPGHFPKDESGLYYFDGTPCFEYADPLRAEHKRWGTMVFDYGKQPVVNFLTSNALFWMEKYHFDGLRIDAVDSMLYLDYDREEGEWRPNAQGGKEHWEAVAFMRRLNRVIFEAYPSALMIAEDSSAWPLATKPPDVGGLGFNFKWNMGWFFDSMQFLSAPPKKRPAFYDRLTFVMMYAFNENYVLSVSHDEVVHGKRSMIEKIPGTYEQKFNTLRAFYMYMYAHPGKKLLFMGQEFAHFIEWNFSQGLDWLLFDYPMHLAFYKFMQQLNHLYKEQSVFWEIEDSWQGFTWLSNQDKARSVFAFARKNTAGDTVVGVFHFGDQPIVNYKVGVPAGGSYNRLLCSAEKQFGGDGLCPPERLTAGESFDNLPARLSFDLPPLCAVYYRLEDKGE